ncbi:MAG: bifunctional phosphopantothenoylcysteine decarboxylase/phosphopantothenate--cysteine ligase CoaBC [Kangiellaceae bacterium]|nr:bifunctional phosphopantothenoylcysteine decarboxylase/phosphopantothenate--cysteine ligase CoaBC [Kangiellaceae bacterium]
MFAVQEHDKNMNGKKILLGITGGIAAYKSAELCRLFKKAGAEVRVVMTKGAQAFMTSLTMQALSGNPVHDDLLDPSAEAAMGHIELARWADLIVVAPATADFMARLTAGMADDLLATLCVATDKPIALAPAMNQQMWANAATQANAKTLQSRGIELWGPASGDQACGEVGLGRMLEAQEIFDEAEGFFNSPLLQLTTKKPLQGQQWLITAGPTQEKIDPVRYLTNRSSGKMGYAIAAAAAKAGADVVLVSGPVNLATPAGVTRVDVQSANDMLVAVQQHADQSQVFIACAAVSDYRSKNISDQKMKKQGDTGLVIELEQNPDILKWAASESSMFCVGFAAETQNVEEYAKAKMKRKGIKVICANDVSNDKIGFGSDSNEVCVYFEQDDKIQMQRLGPALKQQIAQQLVLFLHQIIE